MLLANSKSGNRKHIMLDHPDCLYLLRYFGSADKERIVDVVFCDFCKARKYAWRAALVTGTMRREEFLALESKTKKGMTTLAHGSRTMHVNALR